MTGSNRLINNERKAATFLSWYIWSHLNFMMMAPVPINLASLSDCLSPDRSHPHTPASIKLVCFKPKPIF